MNRTFNIGIVRVLAVVFAMSAAVGCSSGGAKLPARKKMPELTSDADGFESPLWSDIHGGGRVSSGGYAFETSDAELFIDGRNRRFVSVAMPDAGNDSAAVSLLESMKPFAATLLSTWAQQERNGLIIDLAAHNGMPVLRSAYMLERAGEYSIPLVILYDQRSVARVQVVKGLMAELPSNITFKTID